MHSDIVIKEGYSEVSAKARSRIIYKTKDMEARKNEAYKQLLLSAGHRILTRLVTRLTP